MLDVQFVSTMDGWFYDMKGVEAITPLLNLDMPNYLYKACDKLFVIKILL